MYNVYNGSVLYFLKYDQLFTKQVIEKIRKIWESSHLWKKWVW